VTSALRAVPVAVLVLCAACLYPLQRWIDGEALAAPLDEERLYLSNGENVRRLALGYEALLSDLYWLRAIQYFGSKVYEDPSVLDARSDRLKLLYPLLDVTTTLDPRYLPAYRFGGFFIHDYVDSSQAYALLEKGIRNNPGDWRLYHDLGFLYWTDGRCEEAARVYAGAADLPNVPPWIATMAPSVLAECGDISLAERMYTHLLEETEDERVREDMRARLQGLRALKEVELLREAVEVYRQATGQNPPSFPVLLRAVAPPTGPDVPRIRVNAAGEPLDSNGVPYVYNPETGEVTTDPQSVRLPTKLFSRKKQ
jgi:tetratricopeptide (TPR) repeat protein